MRSIIRDESGQTTVEWIVLSIMIAMGLIVIGLAFQNEVVDIIKTIGDKVKELINSISI